jgi:plastocyanin
MKKIFKIFAILLVLMFFIGCKKTEPKVISETGTVETPSATPEEIGVIERITENISEEPETIPEEEPIKPEENISEQTSMAIITIEDLKFIPKVLNVSNGTTVIWQHRDEYAGNDWIKHVLTIYPPSGPGYSSGPMFYGDDFNLTVTQVGRYRYISVPFANRMEGFIDVQ